MSGSQRRTLWFLAATAATGVVGLYVVAVRTVAGQLLDTRAMRVVGAVLGDSPWPRHLLDVISPATVVTGLCLVIAAALAWRGPVAAAAVGATVVGTLLTSEMLKHALVRPGWLDEAGNSLPSGHVSAVAALAVAAHLTVPPAMRGLIGVLGAVLVVATGIATMALGWHRPSDAVASVLLAVGVGAAVAAVAAVATPGPRSWPAPDSHLGAR